MNIDQIPSTCCIEVTVAHNILAVFYEAFTPTVTINDKKERKPWGTHSFSVPPGDYEVAVSYPWIVSECGKNSIRFSLAPGETKRVHYCARLIRFIPGAISVKMKSPSRPAPLQPAAVPATRPFGDIDQQLRGLAKLRDDGVITEEDFGRKKKEILGL